MSTSDVHNSNEQQCPVAVGGVAAISTGPLQNSFTTEEWSRLDPTERAIIEDCAANSPVGYTPDDAFTQLDQSGDVPPWAVPIFARYLEKKVRECIGPPFGFTVDQWSYLNRHREAKGESWFTADEWAALKPGRRRDLCLNLPKPSAANPSISQSAPAVSAAATVQDGSAVQRHRPEPVTKEQPPVPSNQTPAVFQADPSVSLTAHVLPRELLLGNLWAAKNRGRRTLENQVMESNANVRLIVSGTSLCQFDRGVFAEVVRLARSSSPARRSVRDFVQELLPKPSTKGERRNKNMRRPRPVQSTGGSSEDCTAAALERLSRCQISLTVMRPDKSTLYSYEGRLIDKLSWNKSPDQLTFEVSLDPAMSVLFEKRRFTYLNPNVRCRLGSSPLALWLYGFIECHDLRFAYDLRYLQRISGSESTPSEFRRLFLTAVKKLKKQKILYTARPKNGKIAMYKKKPAPSRKPKRTRAKQLKLPLT